MKKIGIDARLFSQTGVGTYLRNLLYFIDKSDQKDITFYVYLTDSDFDKARFASKNIVKRRANYKWHSLSEQIGFLVTLYKDDLDLVHFTYFSYPVLYLRRFVATVHDATPLLFKTGRASTKNKLLYNLKHFLFRIVLKTQVTNALKIITPTLSVKKELSNIYGKEIEDKTLAIYEGVNSEIVKAKEGNGLNDKFGRFFLYVGNFYPHKNIDTLIEGFKKAKTDINLVLAGPDDYFTSRLIEKLKRERNIFVVKNPGTSDLVYLYKNAEALVHPSLSEGFGLPVIEAAYFDLPVIASDIPVFKEILGKDYVSFKPKDANDIADKLRESIRNKPSFDYKKILKKFSFKDMSSKTLAIYREVEGL